jgi:hypothetical protein
VLVVDSREAVGRIPPVLAGLPFVVLGGDAGAIADRVVDALAPGANPPRERPAGTRSKQDQKYVNAVASRDWTDPSERAVAEVLARLGGRVIGQTPSNHPSRVDLAVWVPGLPSPELNPVLVEVAGRGPQVDRKVSQLRRYLVESRSLVGLLVLQDRREPEWIVAGGTAIAVLGLPWLETASNQDFVSLLTRGRNQLVHAS